MVQNTEQSNVRNGTVCLPSAAETVAQKVWLPDGDTGLNVH